MNRRYLQFVKFGFDDDEECAPPPLIKWCSECNCWGGHAPFCPNIPDDWDGPDVNEEGDK